MEDLYETLTKRYKDTKRLVILGIGSFLKSDDAAGVIITEKLKEYFKDIELAAVSIFTGETAPENYTGKIKNAKPDSVLIIDAADMNKEPGTIGFIEPGMTDGTSLSTHMFPIKVMLDYIVKEVGCKITIIGIQPENLMFAGEVTPKVTASLEYIESVLKKVIIQLEEKQKSKL